MTGERGGVNVVMDFIGAPYFANNLNALARDGRLVMQGFMGGAKVQDCNIGAILFKRLRIQGSTLRSRSLEYQSALVQDFVTSGALDMIVKGVEAEHNDAESHHIAIHKEFSWRQIKEAHDEMEANRNIGKIVVVIDD